MLPIEMKSFIIDYCTNKKYHNIILYYNNTKITESTPINYCKFINNIYKFNFYDENNDENIAYCVKFLNTCHI